MPRNYIRWIESKSGGHTVRLRFALMQASHANFWHSHVQPAIRTIDGRCDKTWNWPWMRLWYPLIQHVQLRRCRPLVAMLRSSSGIAVPAAMMLLIERYPAPCLELPAKSVFLWYMATAPTAALHALGVRQLPSLGRACVDAAIVTSQNLGYGGRIWLHADQRGEEQLLTFYEQHCRLQHLALAAVLPSWERRIFSNDGRFFFTEPDQAEILAAEFDKYRV